MFANCGKPTLGPTRRRRRRNVYNGDDYYDYQQGRVMNDGKNRPGAAGKDDGTEVEVAVDDENDDVEKDEDEDEYEDDDNEYDEAKPTGIRAEKKENVPEQVVGDRKKQQQQQRKNKNHNHNNNNGPKGGGNKNRKKNNKNNGPEDEEEEDQGGPAFAFHRLLKDIGTHVASTKNFWKRLPYEVCNNEVAVIETGQNTTCWNGSAVARYIIRNHFFNTLSLSLLLVSIKTAR